MISSLFFTYLWFGGMGYLVYNTMPSKKTTKVIEKVERNVPIKDLESLTGCETQITKIWLKQNNLVTCTGDLLKDGEKTRIVKVNE